MTCQFSKSVREAKSRNSRIARSGDPVNTFAGQSSSLNPFAQRDVLGQHEDQLSHNIGYVYSIVRTIANTIAGQSIHVGRITDDIEEIQQPSQAAYRIKSLMPKTIQDRVRSKSQQHFSESVEVLTEHPFLNALQRPNPLMGKFNLLTNGFTCLELCGVMYWWFRFPDKKNGLANAQIWPLPPSWVVPLHSEDKLFAAFQVRPTGFSAPFVIPGNEVGMFYYPEPSNPMLPLSPLQAVSRTVKVDEELEECQVRHFTNGHKPGLAVIVGRMPGTEGVSGPEQPILTIEQRAQLVSAINRGWQGSINHNNPIVLDGFIKDVKKITESIAEMDYLNSGMSAKRRLAECWGISTIILGEMQTSNRAGATVAKEHYYDIVINPRIAMFSEALTHNIAPLFDDSEDIVVWIENMVAVDQEYDLALDIAMVDRGGLSINEWRQKHNMPPIPGGDEYDAVDPNDGKDPGDKPKAPDKSFNKRFKKSWHQQLGLAGHIKIIHNRAVKMESELKSALKIFFVQMGEKVGAILRQHLTGNNSLVESLADAIIHESEWKDKLISVLKPIVVRSAIGSATIEWNMHQSRSKARRKDFFSSLISMPKLLTDTVAFKVGEWLDGLETPKIFASVTAALKAAIEKVKDTFTGAQAVDKIINTVFGDSAASERASVIASIENTTAINIGNDAAITHLGSLGLVNARRWCTQEDDRVRPSHVEANGQVVGLHEKFSVGGHSCQFPGDPSLPIGERVRCRCFEIGVTR